MTFGSLIIARASSARRCMPPESWDGIFLAERGRPTFSSRNSAKLAHLRGIFAARARPVHDVVVGRHPREQRGLLEHDQPVAPGPVTGLPSTVIVPLRRPLEAGEQPDQRALAAARRADHHRQLAALDGERAVAHDLFAKPSAP